MDQQPVTNVKVEFAIHYHSAPALTVKCQKAELVLVAAVIVQPVCFAMDQNV